MKPPSDALFPRCAIDYPLELTADEICAHGGPINTLLKSSYLLGTSGDMESAFQLLFDIAESIGATECSAYIPLDAESGIYRVLASRGLPRGHRPLDIAVVRPAVLSRYFGKAVCLEAGRDPGLADTLEAWGASSLIAFPIRRNREFLGALAFGKRGDRRFTSPETKLLWLLSMQAENLLLQTEAIKALSFYSFLDPLTHLYNRRYFDNQLEKEILRSQRNGKPFSLLMIDLDGFKAYNDRFHHTVGDVALQEFAAIPQESVRDVDTVARYGGDEFAIILVESDSIGARDLSQRIIERFQQHLLPGQDGKRTERLSASVGIATYPRDAFEKKDLIAKADHALYIAKRQGGGRASVFGDVEELLLLRPATSSDDIPVQKIYDAARSVVNMDKFLEILLFTAMQGMSAGRGSIVAFDDEGDTVLHAALGYHAGEERFSPGTRLESGPITSWIREHRAPLVIPGSPFPPPLSASGRGGYRTDSLLSVPLRHEGRLVGAVHLTNRKDDRPFSDKDLERFLPIADEISRILVQSMEFRGSIRSFSSSILESLTSALELRYPFLSGHSRRVGSLAVLMGEELGLDREAVSDLKTAGMFHDIGIVGVPGAILAGRRSLKEKELELARKHSFLGAKILEGVPGMEEARRFILEHHEFYNGSGYPQGLRGEEISLGGRILCAAEYLDSITSDRPHRGRLTLPEALQMVSRGAGTLFDSGVASLVVGLSPSIEELLAPSAEM